MIRGAESHSFRLAALGAGLCAMLGLFLFVADLGERQHWVRLLFELALLVPLIRVSWGRQIRSRR